MFGLLKNKLTSFISKLAGKEEKKKSPGDEEVAEKKEEALEVPAQSQEKEIREEAKAKEIPEMAGKEEAIVSEQHAKGKREEEPKIAGKRGEPRIVLNDEDLRLSSEEMPELMEGKTEEVPGSKKKTMPAAEKITAHEKISPAKIVHEGKPSVETKAHAGLPPVRHEKAEPPKHVKDEPSKREKAAHFEEEMKRAEKSGKQEHAMKVRIPKQKSPLEEIASHKKAPEKPEIHETDSLKGEQVEAELPAMHGMKAEVKIPEKKTDGLEKASEEKELFADTKAREKKIPEGKKTLLDSVVGIFSPKKKEATSAVGGQAEPKAGLQPDRLSRLEKKVYSNKREMAPKIGIGTTVKSFFSNEITIGEEEVSSLVEELELSLIEADVAYEVSLEVSEMLRSKLVGMKVPKGKVEEKTRDAIREVLVSIMESEKKFDLVERVRSIPKPCKILFIGPNGAGKTTTMAKVARMLMDAGLTVVFSASDTFRAAAIEQTEVHAERLGVKIVKSKYGADPASVAFDAINFARSHSVDVVLIDSAGRQDTNANLLDELKKINRVAKPDLKIYIGESIGGNSIVEQIKAFNSAIGVDGAILTKLDCDAKGGTAISVSKATGIPVLYLGIGQEYSDLVPFDAGKIAQEIMT